MNQPSNEAMTLKVIAHIHTAFPTKFGKAVFCQCRR